MDDNKPLPDSRKTAADKALDYVREGMLLGLGTGTTAYWVIMGIGEKISKQGLKVRALASSRQTEVLARQQGIPLVTFERVGEIDLTIDGADEIDPKKNLIKGGGGALLREKILAYNSRQVIIVADHRKMVEQLGRFPLPVELTPFGYERTIGHLADLGCMPLLRLSKDSPFLTDNGNYILDCHFGSIPDAADLDFRMRSIPGVLETGLFIGLADLVITGFPDGRVEIS